MLRTSQLYRKDNHRLILAQYSKTLAKDLNHLGSMIQVISQNMALSGPIASLLLTNRFITITHQYLRFFLNIFLQFLSFSDCVCLQLVKYKFKLEIKFIVDTFDYVISNISVYPSTRSSPTQIQHWKTPNFPNPFSVSCTLYTTFTLGLVKPFLK